MSNASEDYSSTQVRNILGLGIHTLEDLRKVEAIAFTPGTRPSYNREYVDNLALLWARYPEALKQTCDATFFRLYVLQWEYNHPPADCATNRRRLNLHRKRIKEKCNEIVAAGRAHNLVTLAAGVEKDISVVKDWVWYKKIVTVQVGVTHYLSERYAKHLIKLFTELITTNEAAEILGLERGVIAKKIRNGELPGVKCPDSTWRTDPEVIASLKTPETDETGDRLLTIGEAADRLGVPFATFQWEATEGRVVSVGEQTARRIPESEVIKWEQHFAHLNPAFAWLEPIVMPMGVKPRVMHAKEVMRTLDLRPTALTVWSQKGLLPFFVRSFTTGSQEHRAFVRRYVFGLRKFAGEDCKIGRRIARRYLELCKNNSQIM